MHTKAFRFGMVALLALALAQPGSAEAEDPCRDEDGTLTLTESQQWVRDPGTKAGNLAAVGAADFPTLSHEPPTTSVTEGAGGGYLATVATALAGEVDEDLLWGEAGTVTVVGTTPSCTDTLAVTLHLFPTTSAALWSSTTTAVRVLVGGEEIVATGYYDIPVSPNPAGEATYVEAFALTGLLRDIERAGLDPADEHEVVLQVSPRLVVEAPTVYVWDTIEVPSNVLFNPEGLDGFFVLD